MPVHARNLLLFLALSGAAVLTFMLSREPETTLSSRPEPDRAPQGYYLLGAELRDIGADGTIRNRISAERLEQLPGSEAFELEGMRVEYEPGPNIHWLLTATEGFTPKDRSFFDLRGVSIELTRSGDNGLETASFDTDELHLDADASIASSSRPVVFRQGGTEVTADGLTLNLDSGTYMLGPYAVTIRSEP